MNNELQIERVAHDKCYDTLMITGLSVKEMNFILGYESNVVYRAERLRETMNKYNKNIGEIHSVRHIGGHLLVQVDWEETDG